MKKKERERTAFIYNKMKQSAVRSVVRRVTVSRRPTVICLGVERPVQTTKILHTKPSSPPPPVIAHTTKTRGRKHRPTRRLRRREGRGVKGGEGRCERPTVPLKEGQRKKLNRIISTHENFPEKIVIISVKPFSTPPPPPVLFHLRLPRHHDEKRPWTNFTNLEISQS